MRSRIFPRRILRWPFRSFSRFAATVTVAALGVLGYHLLTQPDEEEPQQQ